MDANTGKDPSTLAALNPAQPRDMHYSAHKNSLQLHGSHSMLLRRPSRQPESGREYVPGDPVNLIDWKAYARTDQLIIREVRDEAAARVLIGIDGTATMHWPDATVPAAAATKAEVAMRVGLHLAHLHLRMGDGVELWLATEDSERLPKLRLKPRSPADLLSAFARMQDSGFMQQACQKEFQPVAFDDKKRDAAFWLGDCLADGDFAAFLACGRRSCLFHVLSSLETVIDWVGSDTSYFDPGLGQREYQGQVLTARGNYLLQLQQWCKDLQAAQAHKGGTYLTVTESTPIVQYQAVLTEFLREVAP